MRTRTGDATVALAMGRIDDIFAELRHQQKRALMPFVCGGHPGPGSLVKLLPLLESAGSAIVEIGFPFSDPIADGPTIAAAMHSALLAGATPRGILEEVSQVRGSLRVGLVAMVSVSLVHRWEGGAAGFVKAAGDAGFDGFIFPDAPLEESGPLLKAAADAGKSASLLIAPTTPIERAKKLLASCTGFAYVLARTGITGERDKAPDVAGRVAKLRELTTLPLAVGFGISKREHVRAVVQHADAAIVGSALVRRIGDAAAAGKDWAANAYGFVRELASGLP